MSFWRGVKQAFGFNADEYDDDDYLDANIPSAPDAASPQTPTPLSSAIKTEGGDARADEADADSTLPSDLFDAVIEVFNSAQPDFIKQCLSTDSQRQYLIGSISEQLRRRAAKAIESAAAGDPECKKLRERVAALEKENKVVEALKRENSRLRLSIENQKRALQDRITDLEIRIEKGGVNPAKGETAEKPETAEPANDKSAEMLARMGREAQRQSLLREQAEAKSRMSDSIITDLRNRVAEYRGELDQNYEDQEKAVAMFDAKIAEYKAVKAALEKKVDELARQLDETRGANYEGRIAKLNEENAKLRHNLENNLYNQANAEMRLRKEIKELRSRLESAGSAQEAAEPAESYSSAPANTDSAQKRKRGRPRKVAIDAELTDTDVFDLQGKAKDDPDFGYHEPPRRPGNTDEAQLTLFD